MRQDRVLGIFLIALEALLPCLAGLLSEELEVNVRVAGSLLPAVLSTFKEKALRWPLVMICCHCVRDDLVAILGAGDPAPWPSFSKSRLDLRFCIVAKHRICFDQCRAILHTCI